MNPRKVHRLIVTHKALSCNKVSFETNHDIVVVSPAIDGRLKYEAKEITRVE